MQINILDWDITYNELVEWVAENDVVLDAVNGYGRGASTVYDFRDEEDFLAFKLKFAKEQKLAGYRGLYDPGSSYFYAPDIPV